VRTSPNSIVRWLFFLLGVALGLWRLSNAGKYYRLAREAVRVHDPSAADAYRTFGYVEVSAAVLLIVAGIVLLLALRKSAQPTPTTQRSTSPRGGAR
jgi:hypothetical protein